MHRTQKYHRSSSFIIIKNEGILIDWIVNTAKNVYGTIYIIKSQSIINHFLHKNDQK